MALVPRSWREQPTVRLGPRTNPGALSPPRRLVGHRRDAERLERWTRAAGSWAIQLVSRWMWQWMLLAWPEPLAMHRRGGMLESLHSGMLESLHRRLPGLWIREPFGLSDVR